MTSRTALLTATLLAASAPTAALARPTIIVDDAIPFSADDLADAVSIRADSSAQIHVNRHGDTLVITVGDQARTIDVIGLDDPHDLARVVALIIVALDSPTSAPSAPATPFPVAGLPAPPAPPGPPGPGLPAPPAPPGPPLGMPAPEAPGAAAPMPGSNVLFGYGGQLPPPKNWTVRFSVGYELANSFDSRPVMATVSRRLGPSAHLVVGVGYDRTMIWTGNEYNRTDVGSVPLRAGIELRHRWVAIEAGLAATRWDDPCAGSTFATGGYAAARAYVVPFGAIQNRLFIEGGVRHVTANGCMNDYELLENRDTTAHASVGLELPL